VVAKDAEVTFVQEEQGTVTHMTAYQDGQTYEGKKINHVDD
jgi:hypothetical protein